MTNTEYLRYLQEKKVPLMWSMYLLWCYVNKEKPSDFRSLKRWLNDEV